MSFSRLADQRAQRPDSSILPAESEGVAPVVPRPTGGVAEKTIGAARTAEERPSAALTAREERVRRMLLRELEGVNKRLNQAKTWAAKKERENVVERLDVDFLDREIAKMQKQVAQSWRPVVFLLLPLLVVGALLVNSIWEGGSGAWLSIVLQTANMGLIAWGYVQRRNAVRRKLFIYEALRALSDADEIDVILDKATRDADRLIEQIVARELEAEARYGRAPRTR